MRQYLILSHRPQVSRNLFLWDEKQETLMSSPIPEHENNRFWLFRDKFVIVEAVLNIIVQATAFARESFFLHEGLKNERAIVYLKIVFFLTTLVHIL